jgi:CMP-N,N'-diacetyllegionaminic acid synthase
METRSLGADRSEQVNVLAVITARGGSKGLPGKNTAVVGGKPLIAWTIDAALGSKKLARAIVSTDAVEIAAVARQWGAEVPFIRPAELALDDTPHVPVLLHGVDWMREHAAFETDYVMLLQPTSPLRTSTDIDAAIQIAEEKGADSVVAMTQPHGHPFWCKTLAPDGRLRPLVTSHHGSLRRQDLPVALLPTGAIYMVNVEFLRKTGEYYGENSYAYVMPPERALDIDTAWDLELARLVMEDKVRRAIL